MKISKEQFVKDILQLQAERDRKKKDIRSACIEIRNRGIRRVTHGAMKGWQG
jgi:hypothetical protein